MTTVMALRSNTRRLAGVLATAGTLITMGGTLFLAEYYARMGATGSGGADLVARNIRTRHVIVCANPENPRGGDVSIKPRDAGSQPARTAS
jgi:hypothetical protein